MTREQIKTLLPVINAFSEGKSVQIKRAGAWIEKDSLYFDEEPENYRIKPSPKFRPWKDVTEFPKGDVWLRNNKHMATSCCRVVCVSEKAVSYITTEIKHLSWGSNEWLSLDYSTDGCSTFHPCGVQISGEEVA